MKRFRFSCRPTSKDKIFKRTSWRVAEGRSCSGDRMRYSQFARLLFI